ncbi:MAG TPA: hypothetical protein VFQ77_08535 [Pseudonocardiaceae bacterium]|jgi:hypothetical protein|nr:hypothetical protein [Pseudonocardiaceae bacterium]
MNSPSSRSSQAGQVEAALDAIDRIRAQVLTTPRTVRRCLQLAELADVEAAWWEAFSEDSRNRLHWRAALAARAYAQYTARLWRHRAAQPSTVGAAA